MKADSLEPPGLKGAWRGRGRLLGAGVVAVVVEEGAGERRKPPDAGSDMVPDEMIQWTLRRLWCSVEDIRTPGLSHDTIKGNQREQFYITKVVLDAEVTKKEAVEVK